LMREIKDEEVINLTCKSSHRPKWLCFSRSVIPYPRERM
jgi:CMP-2-keto-3-deoxyoctulosonic acid synthetase